MANLDEQETEDRRNFLSRSFNPVFGLIKLHYHSLTILDDVPFTVIRDVHMITGDLHTAARTNPSYAGFQLCVEYGKKKGGFMCKDQRATYYIGGICCLMPEVTDVIKQRVRQKGSNVRIVRASSSDAPNGLVMSPKKAIAFFGYLVIMLYKNVSDIDFKKFSDRHLKALFDVVGYVPSVGEDVSVFNNVQHALVYQGYGEEGPIRQAVLKAILKHSKVEDSFGHVCSYVAKVLSWTNMHGFYAAYNMLVLTHSPVLMVHDLEHEVSNLQRAVKSVFDTEMPKYFMILESRSKYYALARSKFPTLVAVAEVLLENYKKSLNQGDAIIG